MNVSELKIEIDKKRLEMISIANNRGFNHKETIRISEALDKLIVEYQKLVMKS